MYSPKRKFIILIENVTNCTLNKLHFDKSFTNIYVMLLILDNQIGLYIFITKDLIWLFELSSHKIIMTMRSVMTSRFSLKDKDNNFFFEL